MNGDDAIKLSQDEYAFRMHMVKFTGAVETFMEKSEKENVNQFKRIGALERSPRKMTAIASGISTVVSASIIGIVEAFRK